MSQTITLPLPPDAFIGRADELSEVERLLGDASCRLLTLVGPGGAGKTRMALEAAGRVAPAFPDGVHFVSLDTADTRELLVTRIADAMRLPLRSAGDPQKELLAHLADMRTLLLLDNFEQVVSAAEVLSEILAIAGDSKNLVTSREALNLREERVFPVAGMRFPAASDGRSLETFDSVRLFVERARRLDPAYQPDDDWPHISRVCSLVQGMPLGVELAASWTKVLPVRDIADEIERNLDFLETNVRNVPGRHRSMRAVFDWSWDLLNDNEREAMTRLSVLRGSFDQAAAREIASAGLPMLSALVGKSLVRRIEGGRYQLHEFTRQYAAERLEEDAGRAADARACQATYYNGLMAEQLGLFKTGRQIEMGAVIQRELDNVRAAWEWAVEHEDVEKIQASVQSLAMFSQLRGRYRQAVARLEAAVRALRGLDVNERVGLTLAVCLVHLGWFYVRLGRLDDAENVLQACRQLYQELNAVPPSDFATDPAIALGVIATARGNYAEAELLGLEGLATSEGTGNQWDQALAHYVLGRAAFLQGRNEEALQRARRSYEVAASVRHEWFLAYCLLELGNARMALGDLEAAKKDYAESFQIRERFEDPEGMAVALSSLGEVALAQKSFTEARKLFERSIALYRDIHDKGGLAQSCRGAARAACAFDDYPGARVNFREAVELSAEIKHVPLLLTAIFDIGAMIQRTGNDDDGAYLIRVALGHPMTDFATKASAERALRESGHEEIVPVSPGDEEIARASEILRRAVSLPSDIGLDRLLRRSSESPAPRLEPSYPDGLTEREVEVLRLIAGGKSNREIADGLFITANTVANHVKNILSKTATANRTEAAAYARNHGLA
jgi:predicted ATPase/DNA-binding CsgD family transcriptional regulator